MKGPAPGDVLSHDQLLLNPQGDAQPHVPPPHRVQFYDDQATLAETVAAFLAEGLDRGDSLVVIATEPRRRLIEACLTRSGADLEAAIGEGRLVWLDAAQTLTGFMEGDAPDPARFEATVGRLVAGLAARGPLRAYGEMVDLLWADGRREAAIHLEELWTDLQRRSPFELLCAYAITGFQDGPAGLERVCGAHTHVSADSATGNGAEPPRGEAAPAGAQAEYTRRLVHELARRAEVERALRESVRDLRAREEALRRSEEQLRDFVENATVGIHSVDANGFILWANRAELELLGYAADEYVGRNVAEFHVDVEVIGDILHRLHRGEELHGYEARLRARDGSIKHVLISSNVYRRDGRFEHTRCFTRDITSRREAEEALRRSERQLRTVADALPMLVALVDTERRYRFVGAAYERWFGLPAEALIGRTLPEVLGEDAFRLIEPYVARALAGETVTFESDVPYRGGNPRAVEATYVPQRDEHGRVTGYVGLVADVSRRKGLERQQAAAAARAGRLLRITAAVAQAVTPEQVYDAVVDQVAGAAEASSAGLWLLDEDGRSARLVRSLGYAVGTRAALECLPLEQEPGVPVLDAMRRGRPIWLDSQESMLREYPHLAPMVSAGRQYRVACVPLISNGRTVGALGFTIEGAAEAGEEERGFLLVAAGYASQALERLRLLEAERVSRARAQAAAQRMSILSRASRLFAEPRPGLSARLQGIVEEIGSVLDSCVGVALVAEDELRTMAIYHPDPEAQRQLAELAETQRPRVGEGVTGTVVATGEAVLLARLAPQELDGRVPPPYRAFLQRFPAHAMMSAPLRVEGRVLGALTATRWRAGDGYEPADLEMLQELADRAAVAIENARLDEENRSARERAEQLYRFADSVVTADRVEEVFEAGLDAIEGALGTERAAILLYDEAGVMRFRAWRGLSDDYRAAVEGHSPWRHDAEDPEPVLVEDVADAPELAAYLPLFRSEGVAALAFIPLVSRGRLLGKFMVYHREPHVFSPHELEVAGAIANHLGSVSARFAAVAELEQTIRYNELFAGALAHDLKTPLSAMITAAQLVLMWQEGAGDKNARPLGRIVTSGQRMNRMIDQLLDFTRVRLGRGMEIQPREANLADLCTQAVSEFELAFPEWSITQEVRGDVSGSWDPDRIVQVVSNLVANAGQHGEPAVGIRLRLDGRSPSALTLEVRNGGAIPPALLPGLFDPFRGTQHRRDHSRGLGLGLYIVKEIVRAHGGSIDVASTEAAGTTFTVRLPRRTP